MIDLQPRDRDVADAIGQRCDGGALDDVQRAWVRAALAGPVDTCDRGVRLFYADVDTMDLPNVDTAEGIWSTAGDGLLRGAAGQVIADLADDDSALAASVVPLQALGDPRRMARLASLFGGHPDKARAFAAFVRRVAEPLPLHHPPR